jgi:rfaE bifunctional protein kinase chain/domain
MTPARAAEIIAGFSDQSILVAGDVMLDRFIVGRVTRISPEAPVPIVKFQTEHLRLGGAANVAHNVVALGGRAQLVGVVGTDTAGQRLVEQLSSAGVSTDGIVCAEHRPTTEKVRVVTERNQQVARIDYEHDADVTDDTERALVERVADLGRGMKALLVSDYLKGAVTRKVVEAMLAHHVPLLVDPKVPHLSYYEGATLVTPNHHEAETAAHMRITSDEQARIAAREFRYRAHCGAVLITRGEHGMWLSSDEIEMAVPSTAREVSDVTGAGDTVVATLAIALAAGATLQEAAILANHAAGIVVGKFGPATVTGEELLAAFNAHN